MVDEDGDEIRETKDMFDNDGNLNTTIVTVEKAGKISSVNSDGTFAIDFEDKSFLPPYTYRGLENPRDANSNEKDYQLLKRVDSDPDQQKVYPGRVPVNLITVTNAKFRRRRQLKVALPVDEAAELADDFLGVMWYSFAPVVLFAIFHWHALQYIYYRNRRSKEANEKLAIEEGMRGPMYGEAFNNMMDDLSTCPHPVERLAYYQSTLPTNLREHLASAQFTQSCQIWFMGRDPDDNGVLDIDKFMPVLDLLYNFVLEDLNADELVVQKFNSSDYWLEFAKIFDTTGDGVLQMDEFETFCRFQVLALYTANLRRRVIKYVTFPKFLQPLFGKKAKLGSLTSGIFPHLGEGRRPAARA